MTKQELERFKTLLTEKRLENMKDLGVLEAHQMNETSANSSGGLLYSDHMPDMGSDAMEREKAFLFASRDGAYIAQIEKALKRIEDGGFGVCRECGLEIPEGRLEAVPTTTICVPCKGKLASGEHRKSA